MGENLEVPLGRDGWHHGGAIFRPADECVAAMLFRIRVNRWIPNGL